MAAQQQPRAHHRPVQRLPHLARLTFPRGDQGGLTHRTAVYGPVCTVVWEGRSREAPPYPDQSGFYEVALALVFSARSCHATSQNPPDSSGAPVGFESCALGGGRRFLQQNLPLADIGVFTANDPAT